MHSPRRLTDEQYREPVFRARAMPYLAGAARWGSGE
jgi:hypothetical protein